MTQPEWFIASLIALTNCNVVLNRDPFQKLSFSLAVALWIMMIVEWFLAA